MTWQLQDAKNRLSELVETTLTDGPQVITRRGRDTAVLISYADYQKLVQKKLSVKEALLALDISGLDTRRNQSPAGRATPINFTR